MIIINHRVNTISKLLKTNNIFGVEIDIRSYKNNLILNHEPFIDSISFENWIKKYNHSFLIANIKEEGIEYEVIRIINKYRIKNYFLLDVTTPQIINLNKKNLFNIANRISKYESSENIKYFKKKNKWLWIDTFDGNIPLDIKKIKELKKMNFKLCLVSPELPLKNSVIIKKFILSNKNKIKYFDAVCSKKTNIWKTYEN